MAVEVQNTGMLLIISGPSGTGKGTLVKKLMDIDPSFRFSCSVTTREPREGEIDGVHYHFVSVEEYNRMVEENAFLEHAKVHGNYYGTLRKPVEDMMADGLNVLL
ncbi:MAG: guanylate kinase, partial [Clostridia bacterium]|nr:guanylate kinase [Clostridia bacterium]